MNILALARDGLRRDLAAALQEAAAQKTTARRDGIVIRTQGGFTRVDLTVRPAQAGGGDPTGLFVAIFDDVSTWRGDAAPARPADPPAADPDARLRALSEELHAKEEFLRTSNEELATSNEELRAANEEMQSVNEELQSANEELETSKEELQSINEELATVNAELQTRMADLSRANNDLNNLLASTGMGTVFVDHALRIQRFTPAITQVMPLIQSDLGRPVGHLASNLVGYDRLIADIQDVLDTLAPREIEVQTRSGAWFLLRIRPYRTLDNVIEGAVITFTDITDMQRARAVLHESEALRRLAVVVRDSRDAVLVQALDGRILAWNPGAEKTYGWSEAEALAMNIRAVIPEAERDQAQARVAAIASARELAPFRARRLTRDGRIVEVWLTAAALVTAAGEPYAIATTERAVAESPP
jgi:two-component system CheB/CheR fusion protein